MSQKYCNRTSAGQWLAIVYSVPVHNKTLNLKFGGKAHRKD